MHRIGRRPVAFALTIALTALSCVAVGITTAQSAAAAGTPNIALTATASSSVLYGNPVTVTLTATNSTTTPGYNVAFSDVLPVGVSYVPGSTLPTSADEPTVLTDQPATGQTTLIWSNATDLPANDTYALSFSVVPSTATLLPGSSFDTSAAAYTNTDPRALVTFSASGVAVPASYTGSATATTHTTITPITVAKSQSYPEGELLRGVHNNKDTYSLVVTNSALNATNSVTVTDYLPAGLEFLGCGGVDNTTNATTNPGSTLEYPGAPPLSAGAVLGGSCLTPTSVTTVGLTASGADGSAPAQPITSGSAVYTQVQWTIGNLAPGASTTLTYQAGVPLKENALFATPPTPASGKQASNLDNNSGPETLDGQTLTNLATISGTYTGALASGATNPVTASGTSAVEAVDLATQKSVDNSTYSVGGKHVYSLTLRDQRVPLFQRRHADRHAAARTVPERDEQLRDHQQRPAVCAGRTPAQHAVLLGPATALGRLHADVEPRHDRRRHEDHDHLPVDRPGQLQGLQRGHHADGRRRHAHRHLLDHRHDPRGLHQRHRRRQDVRDEHDADLRR